MLAAGAASFHEQKQTRGDGEVGLCWVPRARRGRAFGDKRVSPVRYT
jgi:hypothetical protein